MHIDFFVWDIEAPDGFFTLARHADGQVEQLAYRGALRVAARLTSDPTRGGVATLPNELNEGRSWAVCLRKRTFRHQKRFPESLNGWDSILLYSANESKSASVVPANQAEKALKILKN